MQNKGYAKRAVECILWRCGELDCTQQAELNRLNINRHTFTCWARGECNPGASALASLTEAGYDIHYILTGVKSDGSA